jgi:hypothetical protein
MSEALPAENLRAPAQGLFQECEQRVQPITAPRQFLVRLSRSGGATAGGMETICIRLRGIKWLAAQITKVAPWRLRPAATFLSTP